MTSDDPTAAGFEYDVWHVDPDTFIARIDRRRTAPRNADDTYTRHDGGRAGDRSDPGDAIDPDTEGPDGPGESGLGRTG